MNKGLFIWHYVFIGQSRPKPAKAGQSRPKPAKALNLIKIVIYTNKQSVYRYASS
jgi:hypothetical protein